MGRNLVTVDVNGVELGEMEILAAHKNPGVLHRAISVVLYRLSQPDKTKISNSQFPISNKIQVLLQKRSVKKPLWPGYWANTVCTHPLPGEELIECAVRRLGEEIGLTINEERLKINGSFVYQADYNEDLSEHEFDTVIVGEWRGEDMKLNPDEVSEVGWMSLEDLRKDLDENEEVYAPWPKFIFDENKEILNLKEMNT